MEEAHCSQSGTIMLFYGRTHIISIPKYSLVSPGPKHRSATNFSHREISSVPLCALSYSTVPLGLIQGVPGGMCQTSGGCSLC